MTAETGLPLQKIVVNYFRPPQHFFWHWDDDGKVIEWIGEGTLCFREEVIDILKDLSHDGLPSFHSVLLVIAACKADWPLVKNMKGHLAEMADAVASHEKDRAGHEAVRNNAFKMMEFLDRLNKLPKQNRTGDARGHLIRTIFEREPAKMKFEQVREMLFEFNSGRLDKYVFRDGIEPREPAFKSLAESFARIADRFPTTESVEIKLRTGIDVTPDVLPDVEFPDEKPVDLLQELSSDPKTSGLANLTQHLIAALNIPMHAQGQSDQSFGGVSDISNRGNFDRLLLSELAHDDLSLMARLANNEALYLRREELPDDVNRQRMIMVDTTIKMWGMPRIFAIAAALACTRNNKLNAAIDAFVLGGKNFKPVKLDTKQGVIETMEQLDAALHCGDALKSAMSTSSGSDRDEYFLITEIESVQTPAFQLALAELKRPLSFLIAVGRDGQLHFYEFINGRRKLVSEAKFDLNELLSSGTKAVKQQKTHNVSADLPAFMQDHPSPLFFPASKMRLGPLYSREIVWNEVISITADQRVLYWQKRDLGAKEIISYIEPGTYDFGVNSQSPVMYILVHNVQWSFCKLYQANVKESTCTELEIPLKIDFRANAVQYKDNAFIVNVNEAYYSINAETGDLSRTLTDEPISANKSQLNINRLKKIVNNGYTVLNSINYMYINAENEIVLGSKRLRLHEGRLNLDVFRGQRKKEATIRPKTSAPVYFSHSNKLIRFHKFGWADGSEAVVDSRGLLHLRSSDKTVPEITIVLIIGKNETAAWAADGRTCGSYYFTGVKSAENGDVEGFYNNYILRFIEALK